LKPIFIAILLAAGVLQAEEYDSEYMCLAKSIYFEAGNQNLLGKLAVAKVILNRVAATDYPNSICGVVHQYKQFSWYSDGKSDKPKEEDAWRLSLEATDHILFGETPEARVFEDPSIKWYHADYANPKMVAWTSNLNRVDKLGAHIFYSDR
jgi:N-acetylmuramoyl-L-alanine amidase